ncbi:nuclear transport factor 2 family protein [Maribacter polysaccharolyticus]|uniref:nuclear transport factor 2 family protein n=1 Tax=Maribacter polysaccharolyticus TaxID=3020831 RepID=UPI00237F092C|nr:nuclear transport factor 2 family protein [Maribacter polysaccharolyticus]MDE3743283.1 nuclear transport factor 2 family protein [Maribacter polysaccharolyticus]
MDTKKVVKHWFDLWEKGDFKGLPISEDFKHSSPFGTIQGKKAYLDVVEKNKDKFLGYTFIIHEGIYENQRACVRYSAKQGKDFSLEVTEWYHLDDGLIAEIIAYYHIGDIREDRKLKGIQES